MISVYEASYRLVVLCVLLTMIASPAFAKPTDRDKLEQQAIEFEQANVRLSDAVKSATISFYKTLSPGPFKPTATFQRCVELIDKHDLVGRPDSLRDLLNEIYDLDKPVQTPWSEMELHQRVDDDGGVFLRETRHRPDAEPDVHVLTPEISLRWREANSQLDVDKPEDTNIRVASLSDFWPPPRLIGAIRTATDVEPRDFDGRKVLRYMDATGARSITIDTESGLLLADEINRGQSARLRRWLGWSKSPAGVWFPRVVIELRFQNAKLNLAEFLIVREAKFNVSLAPNVFKLGAPAGSVIVDNREGRGERADRINRDVFDASSVDEVENATKPLNEKYTETERAAHVELRRLYFLHPNELIKRISPPFPLSRKYLPRMLDPKYLSDRRSIHFYFIEWQDDKLTPGFSFSGLAPKVSHLMTNMLNHPITDVDIPKDLLDREIPGDFIYRPETPREKLAEGISVILSAELGRDVKLMFHDIEKTVYIARGEFELVPAKASKYRDKPLVAVHGGPHDGDHGEIIGFGDHASLVREVGEYIGQKIFDETQPSKEDLAWSTRWYDLPGTPPEKRFKIDPQAVLKLVTEQTGIDFVEEKRTVTVLKLESE
jgi:hypothetical protein